MRVVNLASITPPADKALVDCFEQPLKEALRLLSIAGLNDAFLFLRKPAELSDGQQYRLRLALALAAGADLVLIDEFCSTLDRVTARIIAWQVRKFADRTGTTFIVATAHDDLYDDLRPDVAIEKLFGCRAAVSVSDGSPAAGRRGLGTDACTVLRDLEIEPADRTAWDLLSPFHYRGHPLPPHSHLFAATVPEKRGHSSFSGSDSHLTGQREGFPGHKKDECPLFRRVIGVVVYGYPSLANGLRNRATGGRYTRFRSRRRMAKCLNREVRTISRVVVDPQYRGLGVAVRLVSETMPRVGTPYVEALATMARVNPFFERAGMPRYDAPTPPGAARLVAALDRCRIPRAVAAAPDDLRRALDQLPPPRRAFLVNELTRWSKRYESAKTSKKPKTDLAHVLKTAAQHLFSVPVYYLWRNDHAV